MRKNAGKVREFCQSGKVGTMQVPSMFFPDNLFRISILEHKNRKILEQLEEQKKRLRMQAQGPGTATTGASRFVSQLKAENVNTWRII